jgi:low temperature requirement protein LtrA
VTLKMADNPGWENLGEGLLILAAVWWAWCAYGWLTNSIDSDEYVNRVCVFAAMGGMLVVSLSIPDAFGDRGVLFGCAYFFVRAMQLVLYVRICRAPQKGEIWRRFGGSPRASSSARPS